MKRLIPLLLLACTLALVVPAAPSFLPPGRAAAQAPNARPQWEYASLVIGDAAADVQWQAGGTTLTGPGDVTRPDLDRSVKELYRQLGGRSESPTLGMLLNLIGRDGWEMVSYAHTRGAQVWMFKRSGR